MPNTHKSAAVPFVNQKGERSMKRVKVERYVAGKKPAYAKEDDDEEYYTTDEDAADEQEDEGQEQETESESNSPPVHQMKQESKQLPYRKDGDDEADESRQKSESEDDDDDDDDPRFRRLKQIESRKPKVEQFINVQKTRQILPKNDGPSSKNIVIEDDDDEDEIRQRHALARARKLDEPLGPQAIFGDLKQESSKRRDPRGVNLIGDDEDDEDDLLNNHDTYNRRLDTDDLLKDFKLTGLGPLLDQKGPLKTDEEREAERKKIKEALEQAKQEVEFTQKLNKKVEDDLKRELEREALAKGDIGAREMSALNTDDEDDELAYEEWKLREIKRVLRDRSERVIGLKEQRAAKAR